jgi:hypothetical protein
MAITQQSPGEKPVASNPANTPEKRVTEATRIPMSVPTLRLEIPPMEGFHLHWFLGQNVARAQKAGYTFVEDDEVQMNDTSIAGGGNADLGSRVSAFAGGLIEGTVEPQRLYLMKLPIEFRRQDEKALEAINDRVADQIRHGNASGGAGERAPEAPGDALKKYLKQGQDLFIKKRQA